MAHDDPDALQACWEALAALQSIIPKEIQVCAGSQISTDWACWLLQRLNLPVLAVIDWVVLSHCQLLNCVCVN